jgi:hypothetical protein
MNARDAGAETWLLSLPPTSRQTRWAIAVATCQLAALALAIRKNSPARNSIHPRRGGHIRDRLVLRCCCSLSSLPMAARSPRPRLRLSLLGLMIIPHAHVSRRIFPTGSFMPAFRPALLSGSGCFYMDAAPSGCCAGLSISFACGGCGLTLLPAGNDYGVVSCS